MTDHPPLKCPVCAQAIPYRDICKYMGAIGGAERTANIPLKTRQEISRKGALIRWLKWREKRKLG